jgi:hypothetical protein
MERGEYIKATAHMKGGLPRRPFVFRDSPVAFRRLIFTGAEPVGRAPAWADNNTSLHQNPGRGPKLPRF